MNERNLTDFDFMVEKITANYAGYPAKVTSDNRDCLEALTACLRQRAATASTAELEAIFREWLAFYRDGHVGVSRTQPSDTPASAAHADPSSVPASPDTTTTSVPRSPDTAPAAAPPASLFLRRLSPETLCLRIPDFNPSRYEPLRRLLDESSAELDATDNLVIDLRSHRGGSDAVFEPILRLLYTRPIIQIGVEYRSTEDNIAEMRRWCATTPLRAEIKQEVERIADLMSTHPGEWVASPSRGFYVERMDSVSSCPKRVAVLIDGAASSGEQFLLLARQSRKVTLFGKRNSAGVLDFSNAVSATVPSGRFTLRWAICRSLRLPEDPVDPEGIPPDIRIPAEVDDPVAYAQAWLERQAD